MTTSNDVDEWQVNPVWDALEPAHDRVVPEVVAVARTPHQLQEILPAWRALAGRCGGVFGLPAVVLPWFEHIGRGTLHVVTVHRGSELVAVAPLHRRRIAGRHVVRWLGHGLGVVGDIVCEPGDRASAAIWEHLASEGLTLDLTSFRHGGQGLAELRLSAALDVRRILSGVCPVVDLRDRGSFEHWLTGHAGLARSLRRIDKRLHTEGLVFAAEVVTSPARLTELLPELRAVSAAGEAHNPRLDLFAPPWQEFTESMLEQLALDGHLLLVLGRLNGAAVAFDLCVRAGHTLYDIFGRFDPSFGEWSPGTLVQRAVVEGAFAAGLSRVDLQLGDDPYKRRWADDSYDAVDVLGAPTGKLAAAARWQGLLIGAYRARTVTMSRLRGLRQHRPRPS